MVRVMVEAPDHDICQKYVDEVSGQRDLRKGI